MEEYNNKVQVISLDEDSAEFSAKSTFDHPYPTTKIMWIPDAVRSFQLLKLDFEISECFIYTFQYRKESFLIYWQPVEITYAYGKQESQTPDLNVSSIM